MSKARKRTAPAWPKCVAVTLNTAIDHIVEVETARLGTTFRSLRDTFVAAGKGIDVAVGVAALGGRAVAAGFIGEESRDVFLALAEERVENCLLEVPGRTRTNVTIVERAENRETHVQTSGYTISAADVERLVGVLDRLLVGGDVMVISGSLPPGAPGDVMSRLIALAKGKCAYVILDASGPALVAGMRAAPQMVKPNLLELGQAVGRPVDGSDEAVLGAAQECLAKGVRRVVASRGHQGIVVVEPEGAWKAWISIGRDHATASVGSGDAVVAAFAIGVIEERGMEDTIRLSVACGAANVFTDLPGRFRPADVEDLASRVQIVRL